jgi:hypothetical protein
MSTDPRDEIAEAVQYGRMTPSEAEAKLKELGFPPLALQPDPADYDPIEQVWWSLPMTVAWIVWRASIEVCEAWDTFRKQGSFWEHARWRIGVDGPVHEGWHLKPRPPASLSLLALKETYERSEGTFPGDAISISDAKASLWKALEAGALQATGKRNAAEPSGPIPEHEWQNLIDVEEGGRDVVRYRERHGLSNRGYEEVKLRRQNVVAIWQPSRIDAHVMTLPATMSPHSPGYMPLYCAAQWIATKGGTFDFEPQHHSVWEAAYSELLARIASDEITVIATASGSPVKLDGYIFANIRVSYPFADEGIDLILSDELYLSSHPYLDEKNWRNGIDDSLDDRGGRKWTKIMVSKLDIARL